MSTYENHLEKNYKYLENDKYNKVIDEYVNKERNKYGANVFTLDQANLKTHSKIFDNVLIPKRKFEKKLIDN